MDDIPLFYVGVLTYPLPEATFHTLKPRKNECHIADHFFQCFALNGNLRILIRIIVTFVPIRLIDNKPALPHILNQWWPSFLTYMCITRPQIVKHLWRQTAQYYQQIIKWPQQVTQDILWVVFYVWQEINRNFYKSSFTGSYPKIIGNRRVKIHINAEGPWYQKPHHVDSMIKCLNTWHLRQLPWQ